MAWWTCFFVPPAAGETFWKGFFPDPFRKLLIPLRGRGVGAFVVVPDDCGEFKGLGGGERQKTYFELLDMRGEIKGGRMVAQWIAQREGVDAQGRDFSYLSDFILMWSYGENKICDQYGGSYDLRRIDGIVTHDAEYNDLVDRCFAFFRERYTGEGGELHYEGLFNGRWIPYSRRVQEMLHSEDVDDYDKIKTVAMICYRIRNNLFHGNKNFQTIMDQRDVISAATGGMQGVVISLCGG